MGFEIVVLANKHEPVSHVVALGHSVRRLMMSAVLNSRHLILKFCLGKTRQEALPIEHTAKSEPFFITENHFYYRACIIRRGDELLLLSEMSIGSCLHFSLLLYLEPKLLKQQFKRPNWQVLSPKNIHTLTKRKGSICIPLLTMLLVHAACLSVKRVTVHCR
jgi:hypothetical protein